MTGRQMASEVATPIAAASIGRAPAAVEVSDGGRAMSVGAAAARDIGFSAEVVARCERVAARLAYAGDPRMCVAVTSAVPGEGVSTVATGVAFALAGMTSGRVVLVDANLDEPHLHQLLHSPQSPGLSEALSSSSRAAGTGQVNAYRTALPNLWVLPTGASPARVMPLLTAEGSRQFLGQLKASFDYVILDTPPLLASVEAESICRLAGSVALVVRCHATPRDDVRRATAMLDGVPVIGAIMTGV